MTVQVKYERPDRRRHLRVTAPLFVDIDGTRFRALDWSLDGLTLAELPGYHFQPATPFAMRLTLPFQGFDVGFDAVGQVVAAPPGEGGVHFALPDLGEREKSVMQHFVQELLAGSMVAVEDTIQRIDVPVMPVQTMPDAPAGELRGVIRPPMRAAGMSGLYAVAGLVVFGYLSSVAFNALFRLEVPTAVVSAPVETIVSLGDGHIQRAAFNAGDAVGEGDVIIRVFDNTLERDIETAEIGIREREAKLAYLVQRQENEESRLQGLTLVDRKNMQQARLEVESLKAQIRISEQDLRSVPTATAAGSNVGRASPLAIADARRKILAFKKQLEGRELELTSRQKIQDANAGKRVFTGRSFVSDLDDVGAQVALAAQEVEFAKQKHDGLVRHRDRLAVRAPFAGVLVELPHVDKGTVKKGDVLAVIEQRAPREVTAYLNQDEVAQVRLGDGARLHIPALGTSLRGRVATIDRTAGFLREQDRQTGPGFRWRGSTDRSAKVTIAFTDDRAPDKLATVRAGLPVIVIFERRSREGWTGGLARSAAEVFEGLFSPQPSVAGRQGLPPAGGE